MKQIKFPDNAQKCIAHGATAICIPDHGRMIWGENGEPDYGLYDHALGIMSLQGFWEGIAKVCKRKV